MLVWVTGLSGTGKSAVARRLRDLGHRTVDADDHGVSAWRCRETGELVVPPPRQERPADWIERHGWHIDVERVRALVDPSDERPLFLFGAVENEAEVLALADVVVCLVADTETLRYRLAARRGNDFGKAPHEIEAVLSWHGVYEDRHAALGAVMVDATRPLEDVADAVLAAADRG